MGLHWNDLVFVSLVEHVLCRVLLCSFKVNATVRFI